MNCKRGEIYYADLELGVGSEQNGERPVLIIQNDVGNAYSPTTIIAIITSIQKKVYLPVHVLINREESGLPKDSVVQLEQIKTIDKVRLSKKVSSLSEDKMREVKKALSISVLS